jgi:Zn-dependent M28 family amino/carboxypeptidase
MLLAAGACNGHDDRRSRGGSSGRTSTEATGTAASSTGSATADGLARAVTAAGLRAHLRTLAAIARRGGGTRAVGTKGYAGSARYVYRRLRAAGYDVRFQTFPYGAYLEGAGAARELEPTSRAFRVDTLEYSPSTPRDGVTAKLAVAPLDADGSHGCESSDFEDGAYAGRIVLVKRGECAFADKAENASRAGAVAVLVYGEADPTGDWTIGGPEDATIPALAISRDGADSLVEEAAAGEDVTLFLQVRGRTEGSSRNVVAELAGKRREVIMMGGHLDSVPDGPGLNDNGSGTTVLVELALQLARRRPEATIRLGFWGAEEIGLVGSRHYVRHLSARKRRDLLVYLNFDMLGSPNAGRFVYGAAGIDPAAEQRSRVVEGLFLRYFRSRGLQAETSRVGASDHIPFRVADIATSGLFTGAGEKMSGRQARRFRGDAGEPFDACYHEPCDTLRNVDVRTLHEMADAAAYVVANLAERPSLLAR